MTLVVEPLAWAHARAQRFGEQWLAGVEITLYSDARPIGGPIAIGPITIFNTVPLSTELGEATPALVFRLDFHLAVDPAEARSLRTTIARYTGASAGDEVASLLSVALGFRCHSGGMSREFTQQDAGTPYQFDHFVPYLARPRFRHAPVLPTMGREVDLNNATDLLSRYLVTSQRKAVALVRSARLYAQALWIAESDVNLAWLLLVSACEVAAAAKFGRVVRPTRRFVDFVATMAPPPLATRPEFGQLTWSRMADHARTIYSWRSRALHDGVPFPAPMCEPPRAYAEDGIPSEIPLGLASHTGTTTWNRRQTPMLLNTFAYIVQGALCKWWRTTPLRP